MFQEKILALESFRSGFMSNVMKSSVLYIIPPAESHRTAEENLGVGYLAAFLREKNYYVEIIDAWLEKITLNEVFKRVDTFFKTRNIVLFVGISTYVSNIENVKKIVEYIKENYNIPIVAGGFGPSFFPNDFLDIGVDIISVGEGEITNWQLCEYFENNLDIQDVNSIVYLDNSVLVQTSKGNLICNLDQLPFPARDTINHVINRKSSVNILSARGCMGYCSFCSVVEFQKFLHGKKWRERSIVNFVDELEELYNNGIDFFKVIDDSFIESPRDALWCSMLADEIQKRNMKLRLRGSLIADCVSEEVLVELKRAGFFSFACGVENFAPSALRRFEKRASLDVNCQALDLLKKHNFYVQCGLILFDPYTTIDELWINLKYLKKYDWLITKGIFTELYAASGTRFTNKLILDSNSGDLIRYNENYIYQIKDLEVRKIYNLLKKWHKQFSYLYDKIIDPLTSPKNISFDAMAQLYNLYRLIHKNDLDILEKLLRLCALSEKELDGVIQEEINNICGLYKQIEKDAEKIYSSEGLVYDGIYNKYL